MFCRHVQSMDTNQFDDLTAGSTSNECAKNGYGCDCQIRHPSHASTCCGSTTTGSDLPTETRSEPAGDVCLETKGGEDRIISARSEQEGGIQGLQDVSKTTMSMTGAGIDCEELDDSGDFLGAIFMAEEG